MKKLFILTLCLLPLCGIAQTVKTTQNNTKIEQLKAEAAKKAEEAKKAAEEAQRAADEALKAAKEVEQATSNDKKDDNGTSEWTVPTEAPKPQTNVKKEENPEDNSKYLAGAVPDVNGNVVFTLNEDVPGMKAGNIYQKLFTAISAITTDANQKSNSRIALVNKDKHVIAAKCSEWLIFSTNFLSLDRTEFTYTIIAKCDDNKANVTISRISYNYEQGRVTGFKESAERLISDKESINSKGKLNRLNAKFRIKTIDRVNEIFNNIRLVLSQK
jgi:hypothetical protein